MAARCGGSYSVTTASFAVVRPRMRTMACRVEPTRCGGGDVQCSSTSPGNQIPDFSTSVRTAKTSSIGRLIEVRIVNLDMRFAKRFNLGERAKLQVLFEFFNIFNRQNPAAVETTPSNANLVFGSLKQVLPGREGQFGVRLEF